ncbi:hypothetical protein F5Y19DRAFT_491339 [Xylariaceae sp. FL1651]|nr:hypothetical protein F5Y19DRAFT_491339 [Xylariaceae sp. FL1651]
MSGSRSNYTSRQHSGLACQECRRKKSRCDRANPCGGCQDDGVECHFDPNRPQRGPKKGHLVEIRSRIAALEQMYRNATSSGGGTGGAVHTSADSAEHTEIDPELNTDNTSQNADQFDSFLDSCIQDAELDDAFALFPTPVPTLQDRQDADDVDDVMEISVPGSLTTLSPNPEFISVLDQSPAPYQAYPEFPVRRPEELGLTNVQVTELVRAELDQLFFDRAHSFVPMLEPSQYLSWAGSQPWTSESHMCLQYAVWMMAASRSPQFARMQDSLYQDTRKILANLELQDNLREAGYQLQQAQALILVAIYEFTKGLMGRAWITIGRAFRLTQFLKLDRLDSKSSSSMSSHASPSSLNLKPTLDLGYASSALAEEGRRTFWMAYLTERLCSGVHELNFSLSEPSISTYLPASDFDTQESPPGEYCYLSDMLTPDAQPAQNALTECIIFSSLWGRVVSHYHLSLKKETGSGFWLRHKWLAATLDHRLRLLSTSYTMSQIRADPLLLFANMMAQGGVIVLAQMVGSVPWNSEESQEYQQLCLNHRDAAAKAIKEIARLSSSSSVLSCLKVHPFLPIPLAVCAKYIKVQLGDSKYYQSDLAQIIKVLKHMSEINPVAQSYLDDLGLHSNSSGVIVCRTGS